MKTALLIVLLSLTPFARGQAACPAFVPGSMWDGLAGQPVGGQLGEFAAIPAGAIYSVDGATCLVAGASGATVDLMQLSTLYVLRTAQVQWVTVIFELDIWLNGTEWIDSFTDYAPIPPTPDGTPYQTRNGSWAVS